ncbi:hypothetical protein AK88_04928 [Plasmodium fragile]|uniref:Schizont-infected cell agglutination extracellular alpha domain-containing protein n=1 Tax=Plasmodium fragile TaxID=5857 RepID=A0A0D9QED7_PLAFR|nr:uncharacterized protein AK88_04928 [Plasmodium fragile]KJP85425.1 hypothetical protein AK88_04928 [Plasmodium fragile]
MAYVVVCRRIVNIFLFMDGLHYTNRNEAWTKRYIFQDEQRLEEYLRCMLGNVALLQLYGDNCEHIEVVRTVSTSMDPLRAAFSNMDISKTCEKMNYRSMKIGTKLIGLTMARWMEKLQGRGKVGSIKSSHDARTCNQGNGMNTQQATATGVRQHATMPIVEMMDDGTTDVVKTLIEKGKSITQKETKTIMNIIAARGNGTDVVEEILQKIEASDTGESIADILDKVINPPPVATFIPENPADTATPAIPQAPSGKDR